MAFTEDLDLFFDTDDFALAAVFTKTDNSTVSANVIFDNGSNDERMYDAQVEANVPQLTVKTSDISGVVRKNRVLVNSTNYVIERIEKIEDGAVSICYLRT